MQQTAIFLGTYWLTYFAIHSLLAANRTKTMINQLAPGLSPYYRLLYNLLAVMLLFPALYMLYFVPSEPLWHWTGYTKLTANSLALLAIIGFLWTLKYYDGMDFLGLRAIKATNVASKDKFCLSPLHRFVRHPWYSLALVIIWTRDMNAHMLITAVFVTAYFFVGSYWEDKKLLSLYGELYQRYRKAVPGIIPSFRRFLTKSDLRDFTS